jgi:hypothetical protein
VVREGLLQTVAVLPWDCKLWDCCSREGCQEISTHPGDMSGARPRPVVGVELLLICRIKMLAFHVVKGIRFCQGPRCGHPLTPMPLSPHTCSSSP